jgi:uncharacterized protein DUF3516
MEIYLRTLLRAVDSSLEDEWERMRNPEFQPLKAASPAGQDVRPPGADSMVADVTRDRTAFTALVRTRLFMFLRAWSVGDFAGALEAIDSADGSAGESSSTWTPERLKALLQEYGVEHPSLRFDPEARNLRHTHVVEHEDRRAWSVQQVLVDSEGHNDWMVDVDVDLEASKAANRPVIILKSLGAI